MARRPAPPFAALAAAAALLLAAGCGSEDTGGALDEGTVPLRPGATTVPEGATVLNAELSGAEEVPGPGAEGGTGTARIVISGTKVCVDIATSKIDPPMAAHVHAGAKGVAGPVVIILPTPKDGRGAGCVTADAAAAAKVAEDPASAYVNVHTAARPDGAVRGQLART